MLGRTNRRSRKQLGFAAIVFCLAGGLLAQDGERFGGRRYDDDANQGTQAVHREGAKMVDQLGQFDASDDQLAFAFEVDGKKQRVAALQNLALERVSNELLNNPQAPWSISGTYTEYRGTNFLIIRRAILKVKK